MKLGRGLGLLMIKELLGRHVPVYGQSGPPNLEALKPRFMDFSFAVGIDLPC